MATHSGILAWRIPWTEGAWRTMVNGVPESDMTARLTLSLDVGLLLDVSYNICSLRELRSQGCKNCAFPWV